MNRVAVQGWVRDEFVEKLLAATGHDFAELKQQALRKDFTPVALPAKASFQIRNTLRDVASKNVIAKLPGSEPVGSEA